MPKVTLKRVLEAITPNSLSHPSGGHGSASNKDPDFGRHLEEAQFQPCKTVRHGFPYRPTAMAYDPVQKLLAIGCFSGSIRIFGQTGVDCHVIHENNSAVIQLMFLINQGALISVCADNAIHLWNLRQKKPAILHSLKFKRESINCCHLPYQCNWLFLGTERGNTHLCNVEKFALSGYSISWNKAIELSQKSHPGRVVSICENPIDESKVLICFASGFAVLWDLRNKVSDQRYHCTSGIRHASWHFEGKQFMCCHDNGSLTIWNIKSNSKPQDEQFPHAKSDRDPCHPIDKVQWLSNRIGVAFVIFSGGLSRAMPIKPSVTVMKGRSITVLEVDYPIVDFTALLSTPWPCDFQDPTALAIATDQELVVLNLEAPGYPAVEPGHALDIHDSPVTCLKHVPDPNTELMPGLYKVTATKPQEEGNKMNWPISGGECGISDCVGIPEVFVTGHADGSVRFWDASAVFLKSLYKLRTRKIFKKEEELHLDDDDPYQIIHISVCPESRILVVANASSSILVLKLNFDEAHIEIPTLNITSVHDTFNHEPLFLSDNHGTNAAASPSHQSETKEIPNHTADVETNKTCTDSGHQPLTSKHSTGSSSHPATNKQSSVHPVINKQVSGSSSQGSSHHRPLLRVKSGQLRQGPGFQVDLACFLSNESDYSTTITYLTVNTSYQLLAFGTTSSLCVVDLVQKSCIFNKTTDSILLSIDKRLHPKSPIKLKGGSSEMSQASFSFDQNSSKAQTDDVSELTINATKPVNLRLPAPAKKSRLTRKHLGDYFAHSPLPFRRNSLFPKTNVTSTPPLKTRHSYSLFNGSLLSPISSPEEELPTEEVLNPFKAVVQRPAAPNKIKSVSGNGNSNGTKELDLKLDTDLALSRTSSLSETDRMGSRESAVYLAFACTYTKKTDSTSSPCLWVGSSGGHLFNLVVSLATTCEQRSNQLVVIAPSGLLLQMKNPIIYCCFIDSSGHQMSTGAGNWREHCGASHFAAPSTPDSTETAKERSNHHHPPVDKQFMVVCSEKQAKVYSLPSQACIHSVNFNADVGLVHHASVDTIQNGKFLACFSSNGYLLVYGLPGLNTLLEYAYFPPNDERILNTFSFIPNGQAIYSATPFEIQRMSISVDINENIQEVIGNLFVACSSPERPNPGFFKGLFGGGHTSIDREELFGENCSGRASRAMAEYIPGTGGASLEGLRTSSSGIASDMQRLRMQAQERGEKLGELDDRAQRMHDSASKFSSDAHAIMLKYKNKKWYQF